jgi:hypothetical protein
MVTTTLMNAQRTTRFYSLPFISNYVRDENNNVYCTSTRCQIGKWSNTNGVIEIDGYYYHGPPVEPSQNRFSTEIEFTPQPITPPPSPSRNSNLAEFFQMDYHLDEPTMEPLELSDLALEEGEIIELHPIEGASQFRYSDYGHIVFSMEDELDEETPSVGYPIIKTFMGPDHTRRKVFIRFFPQYSHLSPLVENPDVIISGRGEERNQ